MSGDIDFYADYYGIDDTLADAVAPSWNMAPTDEAYVVREKDDARRLERMRWGLIPHWSKDERTIHINARVETIADKAAFKRDLALHRCLIPADGFYEWEPKENGRTPHWVYRADGFPMTFAGIWGAWRKPDSGEWERRFSIVTTKAEGVIASIHDRMPVILPDGTWDAWLDREVDDPQEARSLIRTIEPDLIMEHEVTSKVNSVRNNSPDLNEPGSERLF